MGEKESADRPADIRPDGISILLPGEWQSDRPHVVAKPAAVEDGNPVVSQKDEVEDIAGEGDKEAEATGLLEGLIVGQEGLGLCKFCGNFEVCFRC